MNNTLSLDWFTRPIPRNKISSSLTQSTGSRLQDLQLGGGKSLRIERPLGALVSCRQGTLWITHDSDCKDIVIEAGNSYLSDRAGRMIVHALGTSAAALRMEFDVLVNLTSTKVRPN